MDINLFTAAMKQEFLASMKAAAVPAPFEALTSTISSTARLENFAWMTPSPGIQLYMGKRRAAQIDQIRYTLENRQYDGTLRVPLRDVEDDQVGGYKLRMGDLTIKAGKPFESRLVFQTLANGGGSNSGGTCFDGTKFFATTHALGGYASSVPSGFGGGANALTYTSANTSDGATSRLIFLIHGPQQILKPLLLLKRKPPKFMTDAGTPQSEKQKFADYWIDLEASAGYGYWWDAIRVTITNSPSLLDMFACIDAARQMFRTFTLPTALDTDPVEYVHEQTPFNAKTATIACSTNLEQLLNHALNEDRVGVSVAGSTAGITNNIYRGSFGLVTSALLNGSLT